MAKVMPRRWLSIAKAARYTGLSAPTLRRYEALGMLEAFRTPGGHRRYLKADLDEFMPNRVALLEGRKKNTAKLS